MAWKKEDEINFRESFKNKSIPILTLDQRWHELFPDHKKTSSIKNLESKLNQLIRNQGKMIDDIKQMKKLKTKLMSGIVANMESEDSKAGRMKTKKVEKSQQLIIDINTKVKKAEDDLVQIPYQIKAANEDLLDESMKISYERLKHNKEEVDKISLWVAKVRDELKDKILIKQEMEMNNAAIYSYMHDLLGAQTMERFDVRNNEKQLSTQEIQWQTQEK